MSKKYDEIQEEPLKAAEPVATYGLQPNANALHAQPVSSNAHTAEEMHTILIERIRRAEAGQEEIIPNQIVFDSIRTKYGF